MIIRFSVDPNAQPQFRWCAVIGGADVDFVNAEGGGRTYAVLAPTLEELQRKLDTDEVLTALKDWLR